MSDSHILIELLLAGFRPAFLMGSIMGSVVASYGLFDKINSGEMSLLKIKALVPTSEALHLNSTKQHASS
jgi:hypothetical protein